jgi:hypothetical protein
MHNQILYYVQNDENEAQNGRLRLPVGLALNGSTNGNADTRTDGDPVQTTESCEERDADCDTDRYAYAHSHDFRLLPAANRLGRGGSRPPGS